MTTPTFTLFEQAQIKVKYSESLSKYADKILADWPEGDEHWRWVLDASDEEIIEWAEAGLHSSETEELFG